MSKRSVRKLRHRTDFGTIRKTWCSPKTNKHRNDAFEQAQDKAHAEYMKREAS